MRNAESFWKEPEELCKSMGNNMKRQLDLLANEKAQKRNKIIWQTKEFKRNVLRLRDRYSLFKIIFGGVIIVLANKSITTGSLTLLSVTVII